MNAKEFQTLMELATQAGHQGKPMPNFGKQPQITRVQMAALNRAYDEARNAHDGKSKTRRRK